jgi:hypothetical protein
MAGCHHPAAEATDSTKTGDDGQEAAGTGGHGGAGAGQAGTVGQPAPGSGTRKGTPCDLNADGFADLVVGTWQGDKAQVYLGGAAGLTKTPVTTLFGPAKSAFGSGVVSAGDLNGDGFADVLVSAWREGQALVYLGSTTGLPSTPSVTLTGKKDTYLGITMTGLGDVNGDGFDDLFLGSLGDLVTEEGYVYLGSTAGLQANPAALQGPANISFGASVTGVGDLDGDGFADLVVGSHTTQQAYVYRGSTTGLPSSPSAIVVGPDGGDSGVSVARAGDVNGDGFADLLVMGDGVGRAYLYRGSPKGFELTPSTTLVSDNSSITSYFSGAIGVDVNSDGFSDLVVISGEEQAKVFMGSPQGLTATAALTLTVPNAGIYPLSVASVGDINGDGFSDVVLGAIAASRSYVFLGGKNGLESHPSITLIGKPEDGFGSSVARTTSPSEDGDAPVCLLRPG